MKSISPLLLCLLWSLVEVQSQTAPYISFMGNTLPNHSYVNLDEVGPIRDGPDNNTVQCHTDLMTCCLSPQDGRGDWFAPGSDIRLPFKDGREYDIYETRRSQVLHIQRRYNATGPSGIYRCFIATNDVHNDSDPSVGEAVYVGLYHNGGVC